jgi:uncharacterized membrane protein YfcA
LSALLLNISALQLGSLLATALVAGLARGFSGFGGALIFIPVASAVIGPRSAAPLLLIVDAVTALGLIPDAWRRARRTEVGTMSLGAVLGVPFGTYVLARFDALTLRWGITIVVASLLVLLVSGWRYHGRPSAALTAGVGCLAGFCSGAAQIGGPPVVAYWLGGASPSGIVRANVVLYFAASTALTVASYIAGHLITPPIIVLAVASGPVYGIGLLAGSRVFERASETAFRRICYGLIACAAVVSLPALDGLLR